MQSDFKDLRRAQLDRSLAAFIMTKQEVRPQRGWLRAVREALGLSLERVAEKLGIARKRIQEFEEAEARDRITLHSLRRVADAMDCELVYAVVPKSGTIAELSERLMHQQVTKDVNAVERTMALENQAPGDIEKLIQSETKRRRTK